MTAHAEALRRALWPRGDGTEEPQVYALLDGARDQTIAALVRGSRLSHECLYAGVLSPALQAAAPYLVHLAPRSRFFDTLMESAWGRAWGIFAVARPDVSMQQLRQHFRTLLRVRDESGRVLAFRFYDPRVLRAYLPTCTPEETRLVFGPLHCLVAESPDGDGLIFAPRHRHGREPAGTTSRDDVRLMTAH